MVVVGEGGRAALHDRGRGSGEDGGGGGGGETCRFEKHLSPSGVITLEIRQQSV